MSRVLVTFPETGYQQVMSEGEYIALLGLAGIGAMVIQIIIFVAVTQLVTWVLRKLSTRVKLKWVKA